MLSGNLPCTIESCRPGKTRGRHHGVHCHAGIKNKSPSRSRINVHKFPLRRKSVLAITAPPLLPVPHNPCLSSDGGRIPPQRCPKAPRRQRPPTYTRTLYRGRPPRYWERFLYARTNPNWTTSQRKGLCGALAGRTGPRSLMLGPTRPLQEQAKRTILVSVTAATLAPQIVRPSLMSFRSG